MNVIEASISLYEKIKHLNCVKGCTLQDEKTILVMLKHHDQDALHEIPMFYEGYKVYHKVQADAPKPKPKTDNKKIPKGKNTSSSGSLSKAEGQIRDIAIKIRSSGGEKTQW